MVPYWGKGGILWLSYLLNESGVTQTFLCDFTLRIS